MGSSRTVSTRRVMALLNRGSHGGPAGAPRWRSARAVHAEEPRRENRQGGLPLTWEVQFELVRRRRDAARWIGRRRRCIGRGLGGGIGGRANHGTNRDASRDTAPVWSGVVVAAAAAAPSAVDIHVLVGVYVRIPVAIGIPIDVGIPVNVRCVPMKIVAVEIAAAVSGGGALATTTARPLTATTTARPLTATAAATPAVLHKNQPRLIRLDSRVDRSRNAIRREWLSRRRDGAARDRQSYREQQYGFDAHFSVPNIWLEAP